MAKISISHMVHHDRHLPHSATNPSPLAYISRNETDESLLKWFLKAALEGDDDIELGIHLIPCMQKIGV